MRVSEVMTRGAECTHPDATVREAAVRMQALDIGSLPVCENDRLVGMVTDRDVTVRTTAAGADPNDARVRDAMTPGVHFCFDDQDVAEAAQLMKDNQVRRLPVLDRNKRMVGIVSLGDLAVETQDEQLAGNTLEAVSEPAEPNR
ncbi:MAG TPA: CBS domain-containing protein [Gemmataceae bacterium]|nr:CBS domain-containing protein [Gemmataceae bacterium]